MEEVKGDNMRTPFRKSGRSLVEQPTKEKVLSNSPSKRIILFMEVIMPEGSDNGSKRVRDLQLTKERSQP